MDSSLNMSALSEEVVLAMNATSAVAPPAWMVDFVEFRKRLFLKTVEPVIVTLLGPVVDEAELQLQNTTTHYDMDHRRLGFLPDYVVDAGSYRETSMSFASLAMLFVIMGCLLLIFLSCFYHNQKTSPLFISPRRHRLPKLVPPPLPINGYFTWVSKRQRRICRESYILICHSPFATTLDQSLFLAIR